MVAREIMTKNVITLAPEMLAADAQQILLRYRIHGAPVVGPDHQLIGSVSYTDLLGRPGDTVLDVMATSPVSASEDTPVEQVAAMMLDRMVRRVPIVRGGQVVGIVSTSDIIQLFVNLHEKLARDRPKSLGRRSTTPTQ
jgi:CBS domain-containing protein